MNKKIYSFFISVFLFLGFLTVSAQQTSYYFKHLTVEDGLSQSTVFCVLQDKKGFMWFGTSDGLNKYDGYRFTVYNNNPLDSTSISGNSITSVYEDPTGDLWVGTSEGILNKFNRSDNTFEQHILEITTLKISVLDNSYYTYPLVFSRHNNQTITTIMQGVKDHLWIGTWGNGLIDFNKKTGKIDHYFNVANDSTTLSSNRITSIAKDSDGHIWVGTFGGGLNRMVKNKNVYSDNGVTFVRYQNIPGLPASISDNHIISLYADRKKNIWIGTFQGGLNLLPVKEKFKSNRATKFECYVNDPVNPKSLSANFITSITEDKFGTLWVGTFGNGLNKFIASEKSFMQFKNDPFNQNTLSDNDVLSLHVDKSGVLWIGTHLGRGISKLEWNTLKFGLINKKIGKSNSLNDDVIWAIHEDKDSILWIGTYRGGLNRYDRKTKNFTAYVNNPRDTNSINDNHIRAITEDNFGNLWIGTYSGGLNRFNKETKKFTHFRNSPTDPNSIGSDQIQSLVIDKDGICYVGTFGGGLNYFNLKDYHNKNKIVFKKITANDANSNRISSNRTYTVLPQGNNILWIGTFGGGLNKYDKRTQQFDVFRSDPLNQSTISDDRVISLFLDSIGDLWAGTYGGGLNKFDIKNNIFQRFGQSKGFDTQVIYGILEDDYKNLWMSSDNGIIKYNLKSQDVTAYNLNDGLQSMEFSGGAYFKNKKGEMFFGGIAGLNYFYPDSVRNNTHIPPIVISEFKIFNETVNGEFNRIEVNYDQNFFTIEFAALDYTDPPNNQYAYYMEGLENDWNFVNASLRKAFYTNLEPGTYIFRAKGSNSDGVWNQEGVALTVVILPPFWKTWWFILASILLIGGIVSFLISMKVKHLLAIEKLKVRLAADLHDNVGAGLTEISILSELASNEVKVYSQHAAEKINAISNTARHLVDSMSDIVWFVNPKRDSLHDLIIRLKDSYSDLLSEIGVSFKTNNLDNISDVKIPMDIRQNLYLIFKEAINNSIKHSNCNKISLETGLRGSVLEMTLKDDGIGIKDINNQNGNGLKNMQARAKLLGATLTIDSVENKGTTITFTGRIEKTGVFQFLWS